MKTVLCSLLLLAVAVQPALAKPYRVDTGASEVTFSGTHADKPFTGTMESFDAQIDFNPVDLPSSSITATFDLTSAKTGDAMYDSTLPEADWFDIKNFPKASFRTTGIVANSKGGYTALGELTMRGKTLPLNFDFTLSDLNEAPVTATGAFIIDRLSYGIGAKSDAKAEWVGKDIKVQVKIVASPTP